MQWAIQRGFEAVSTQTVDAVSEVHGSPSQAPQEISDLLQHGVALLFRKPIDRCQHIEHFASRVCLALIPIPLSPIPSRELPPLLIHLPPLKLVQEWFRVNRAVKRGFRDDQRRYDARNEAVFQFRFPRFFCQDMNPASAGIIKNGLAKKAMNDVSVV